MKKTFPPSELILNDDGSIYHLNLHPEELADTVITVGDPDRVAKVSAFFDSIEVKKQKREFITHTGIYRGKRLSVISTGIGTDNIDIVFNELDALVNIDLERREPKIDHTTLKIVRIGTSGSLHADIPCDSVVLSEYGLGFDGLMNYYAAPNTKDEAEILDAFNKHFGKKEKLAAPYLYSTSATLQAKLSKGLITGITGTCSGFFAPQGRKLRYDLVFPDMIDQLSTFKMEDLRITNFEMETSAMCGLGRLLGHEACSVNAIVANRVSNTYAKKPEQTMREMIGNVLDRLTE
jgi:uridine phosphorylase